MIYFASDKAWEILLAFIKQDALLGNIARVGIALIISLSNNLLIKFKFIKNRSKLLKYRAIPFFIGCEYAYLSHIYLYVYENPENTLPLYMAITVAWWIFEGGLVSLAIKRATGVDFSNIFKSKNNEEIKRK